MVKIHVQIDISPPPPAGSAGSGSPIVAMRRARSQPLWPRAAGLGSDLRTSRGARRGQTRWGTAKTRGSAWRPATAATVATGARRPRAAGRWRWRTAQRARPRCPPSSRGRGFGSRSRPAPQRRGTAAVPALRPPPERGLAAQKKGKKII